MLHAIASTGPRASGDSEGESEAAAAPVHGVALRSLPDVAPGIVPTARERHIFIYLQ
jgi:hypothetical protein